MNGEIVDQTGRVSGRHQEIVRYTTGQQVVAIEPGARRIVMAPCTASGRHSYHLRDMTWPIAPLPASSQACVLHDGSRVLGGGFIRRSDAT